MLFLDIRRVILVIVSVFLITAIPLEANAKWRSQSDELPGMVDSGVIVGIAALGVIIIGVMIYKSQKASTNVNQQKDGEVQEKEQSRNDLEPESISYSPLMNTSQDLGYAKLETAFSKRHGVKKKSIKPFLSLRNNVYPSLNYERSRSNVENVTLMVGLSANF